ncbi:DUF3078 domain-containing protein [Aquimarina agarilytica]|uniref:DUF3078 domain-containing protein n=1 Tax=Aquimarina agarilytica TaxID=1087449 RepID=UPI000289CD98|nr:DUF3078 domain-containing protein [Aquimarina agarilytica]
MKKIIVSLSVLMASFGLYAQEETKTEEAPKEGWKRFGNASILFNQSAFNNDWATGGINSLALDLAVSYDVNYLKGDWTWDNKFIGAYGIAKVNNADSQKTNDRLEINSLVGKKAGGLWSYSFFGNFRTQFDAGFETVGESVTITNADGTTRTVEILTIGERNSHFFSPAYLQFGPGMVWKKSDNLKVNIAPATSRFIFVHDEFTVNGDSFGVEQGDTSRFEFGASLQGYYKLNVAKNISVENILSLYSNYLEDPQNVDIDYTMNLVMKVNKYISANLTFQALYDDNTVGAFQIREAFGAGLNYGF